MLTMPENIWMISKMKKIPHQIFLSYAREDKESAEVLYGKLLRAGHKPWMDTKDIIAGEKWEICIKNAIKNSDFFLVCLSGNSLNKRGFLQKEIRDALNIMDEMLDNDIYLIPVRFEDCSVQDKLNVFQWVNLYEKEGISKLNKAIEEGVNRRFAKDKFDNNDDINKDINLLDHIVIENDSIKLQEDTNKEEVIDRRFTKDKYENNNDNNEEDFNLSNHTIIENNSIKQPEETKKDLKGTGMIGYLRKILESSQICKQRFDEAEKLAYGIFEDKQGRYFPLPYYNEYGIKHCQEVETFLDEILSHVTDPNKDFIPNPEEAMYLLSGAWTHDIGMMFRIFTEEQCKDIPKDPDICAKLRNEHEKRTSQHLWNVWNIECNWTDEEKAYLANICHYHRMKNRFEEFSLTEINGTITKEKVRIKVIAALLRIANACHIDRSMITGNLENLYDSLKMQPEDVCYHKRSNLISSVEFFHSHQQIVINSLVPEPVNFDRGEFDFKEIIELVRKEIEEVLKEVQTVILPYTNTAFREVLKKVNELKGLNDQAPQRCLGIWPYFLKKPFSATEGASSLAKMLLFELKVTQNYGDSFQRRIRGMIKEVIQWRPYDVSNFKIQQEVDSILSTEDHASPYNIRLKAYLNDFLINICKNCNKMTNRIIKYISPDDILFVYGYSINIKKFLEAIKNNYSGIIYIVDSHPSDTYLQFEPHEDEQISNLLNNLNFNYKYIKLNEVSLILQDLKRTNKKSKILLGTHSVLFFENDYHLLCKKGCKILSLAGKDGGAEVFAFAETNKFTNIEENTDIHSVSDYGFSYNQDNGNIEIANHLQNSGIKMDLISKSYIDYLITEERIYDNN